MAGTGVETVTLRFVRPQKDPKDPFEELVPLSQEQADDLQDGLLEIGTAYAKARGLECIGAFRAPEVFGVRDRNGRLVRKAYLHVEVVFDIAGRPPTYQQVMDGIESVGDFLVDDVEVSGQAFEHRGV